MSNDKKIGENEITKVSGGMFSMNGNKVHANVAYCPKMPVSFKKGETIETIIDRAMESSSRVTRQSVLEKVEENKNLFTTEGIAKSDGMFMVSL